MSRSRPLGLSSAQLLFIANAAISVPPHLRERFQSAVADQLTGRDSLTDPDVQAATIAALLRFNVEAA